MHLAANSIEIFWAGITGVTSWCTPTTRMCRITVAYRIIGLSVLLLVSACPRRRLAGRAGMGLDHPSPDCSATCFLAFVEAHCALGLMALLIWSAWCRSAQPNLTHNLVASLSAMHVCLLPGRRGSLEGFPELTAVRLL
jgi:hypothetical protein